MATTGTQEIVLTESAQLLGPGSVFEQKRLALQKEASSIIESAKKITVNSVESAEQATQAGRVLQVAQKERETFFKNVKTQIDAIKRPVLDAEKQDIDALVEQKTRLGSELTKFNDQQRRIREEVERKAREAAEAVEREAILARAIELEEMGETEQANAVLDEPIVAPVVIQSVTPPKVSGQVGKVSYAMEVTDLMTLVKAVAAGIVPLSAVEANESYLNGKARLEREGYSVPGTKLVKKESTFFRS